MNTIDICNIAMALVGVDRGIESLDDDSPEARYCKVLFPQIRQNLLRDHPWRWASRRVALATLTETITAWDYAYAYPSECLKVLAVEDEDPDPAIQYEHEIRALTGSTLAICCDVYQAYCRYTKDVDDANLFDPSFVEAITHRLASRLALSLSGQKDVAQALGDEADRALGRAKFIDASEGYREPYLSSRYIDARTA